jgi:hypothetical protein
MAALDLTPQQRAAYSQYHRDALLRFLLLKSEKPLSKADQVLARFAAHAEGMGDAFMALKEIVDERCERGRLVADGEKPEASWCRSLIRLLDYVALLCRNPDYHLDPFAAEPEYAPLFKALHGLANHLGVTLLDEALAHHLLLCAVAPDAECLHRVVLLPA